MKRILLDIAYEGTNYCGWQFQPNGLTIEEVLDRELSALLGEDIRVIGASRTDSGVHAWQNVCVFDTGTRIPPEKIAFAINARLPEDIRVQGSREVPPDFHPRKRNTLKTYEYRILNRRVPFPALRRDTYFVYAPLDVGAMREALSYLVGEHDFKSFASEPLQAEETIRTITSAQITCEEFSPGGGRLITIRLTGTGFLTHMVRIIAGTLIKIGKGQWPSSRMKEALDACDRQAAGPKAPAEGLTLISIEDVTGLAPVEHVENDRWDYTIYRLRTGGRLLAVDTAPSEEELRGECAGAERIMPGEHYAVHIFFHRCAPEYELRNASRLTRQAFRDRADSVLIR